MTSYLDVGNAVLRSIGSRLAWWRHSAPITNFAELEDFVATRAAFVAQSTLYGYLRTRIGTRWPEAFNDDVFSRSINIAKMHVFTACLSDLTIYAVAHGFSGEQTADETRMRVAQACFENGLMRNAAQAPNQSFTKTAIGEFKQRLEGTDWHRGAKLNQNFTRSPLALVRWAPIAPELKNLDMEIVENSIKFAWQDVRAQYLRRLNAPVMVAGS